jgi:hypothetical protein
MKTGIRAVVLPKGDPAEVLELVGGPLDGQRWRLPLGCVEFAIHTGECRDGEVSLYARREGDRLHYAGEVDFLPDRADAGDDGDRV